MDNRNIEQIEKILNYHFNDNSLLELALTHRSFQGKNNERLEFLGDSILNFIIPKESNHIQTAPVTNEVFSNYSYSIQDFSSNSGFQLKEDYKNIILIEVMDGYKSLLRLSLIILLLLTSLDA